MVLLGLDINQGCRIHGFLLAVMYRKGLVGPDGLLVPTELWLWAAVATDLTLTLVLGYSLRKLKKGFNRLYGHFIVCFRTNSQLLG